MSQTITSVPEAIARSDFNGLIESLGLDPFQTRRLEFHPEGVSAEVYALNDAGTRYVINGEIATHQISIRVVED